MTVSKTLIESVGGNISIDKSGEVRPGCLGKLKGIIADFSKPTRNGRLYPEELWTNVFEKTPWVKEALETKTLFGEADHPEDRSQTLITEAAVVLTDYKIDDEKKKVYGSFDILDTPKGRILKTLADYGSVLGVSTRGDGVVNEDATGQQIVDPDSYQFAAVDVVILPAVKEARQQYVNESLDVVRDKIKNVRETLSSEIETSSDESNLRSIKSIVENIDIPSDEKDSLYEKLDQKLLSVANDRNTIPSEKLQQDIKEAYDTIESLKGDLKKSKSNTISPKDYKESLDKLGLYKHRYYQLLHESKFNSPQEVKPDNTKYLYAEIDRINGLVTESVNSRVESNDKIKKSYQSKLDSSVKIIESLTDKLGNTAGLLSAERVNSRKLNEAESKNSRHNEILLKQIDELKSSNRQLTHKYNSVSESLNTEKSEGSRKYQKLTEDKTHLNESMLQMGYDLEDSKSQISSLNEKLSSVSDVNNKLTTENESLKESLNDSLDREKNLLSGYAEAFSMANGISFEENKSRILEGTDIDSINKTIYEILNEQSALNNFDRTDNNSYRAVLKEGTDLSNVSSNEPAKPDPVGFDSQQFIEGWRRTH